MNRLAPEGQRPQMSVPLRSVLAAPRSRLESVVRFQRGERRPRVRRTAEQFELYLDASLRPLPDELDLELRFPRRVEVCRYGCAWVT